MYGTIIHYDPLTQCGLLRTEAGQVQYFRLDEVSSEGLVAAGQPVALRNGILVYTGGSQFDANWPTRPATPAAQGGLLTAGNMPVGTAQVRARNTLGWIGGILAIGTLLLLLLSGGQQSGYASPNPKLIESTFGVLTAALLSLEAVFFFTASSRRRVKWTFWLIVWGSLFAYVGKTFDGFEADDVTGWYAYALLILGFAVYILPYRK